MHSLSLRSRVVRAGMLVALVLTASHDVLAAQAQPAPRRPAPAQPRAPVRPPATPARPAPAPQPVVAPAPPPPQDLRVKTVYTNAGMKTETVTLIKGERERFEFQDMVLLKQRDQKRTIQISTTAKTYLIIPDGAPAPPAIPGVPAAAPKPPGVVMVATSIVDTGERKPMFGQQARHVKVTIDRQPMAGACDMTRQRIETDGWYIDQRPATGQAPVSETPAAPAGGCADQIQATNTGDPKLLGFPVAYTTTMTGEDGKPIVAAMEVTELQQTTLDAALFEIPPGLNAAMDVRALSKALSDVNEVKLAQVTAEPAIAAAPKTPGIVRIGVPEFTNKTQQAVDTRGLRQRMITNLGEVKLDAVPMTAGTPAELQQRAAALGYDYVLLAEVTELKVNKPGGLGGMMRAATGIVGGRVGGAAGATAAGAAAAAAPKENTESSVAVKLLQADGKQRLSTTAKGKDGSGFSLQTGLGLAKFAGGMYLSMFAGPQMFARLNSLGMANFGGMGMLGNPMLYQMQVGGLSSLGRGVGIDTTAGAASFMVQQAMAMNDLGGYVGVPGQGPSYDESLGEAIQNAAKAVEKALQK